VFFFFFDFRIVIKSSEKGFNKVSGFTN